MTLSEIPWISVMTLVPLLGAAATYAVGRRNAELARETALATTLFAAALAGVLLDRFDSAKATMQLVEEHVWIESLGINYRVGVDGLSLVMVLLTAILVPMAVLASWRVKEHVGRYFALMLALQAGLFGTFTAQSFFHWFIFWELGLVPAFFLIKMWGGPKRGPAATQFFVYTMVGSIAMLLGFLAIYHATGEWDFEALARQGTSGRLAALLASNIDWPGVSSTFVPTLVFLGVVLGFAVKVPLWPLHTWLPNTYAEAPSPVTMLLTGAMSKMGVYGFLRLVLPLFPEQAQAMLTPLLWLTVATIVLSACAAFAQKDLKRILAYSSINHLGYCLLGLFATVQSTGGEAHWAVEKAAALNGVILQMFNHGLTAAALFTFVAFIEHRTGGLRGIDDFGGLRKVAPTFCGLMGVSVFASLGLPGLNGFVGEFLIFKGAFALTPWAAVLSAAGLLVTAVFLLTMMQKTFHGPLDERWKDFADLSTKETLVLLPATVLMFAIGIYPKLLIELFNETTTALAAQLAF